MADEWLKTYYGKHYDVLSPTVYKESANFAVVRITSSGRMGLVLIKKNGKHNHSKQKSMREGLPTSTDIVSFQEALEAAEKDGL